MLACGLGAIAALAGPRAAQADRYEATVVVRPGVAFGRAWERVGAAPGAAGAPVEPRSDMPASVSGGSLEVAVGYGWRNWADAGAALGAVRFERATYDAANVTVRRETVTGRVERTTRTAQLVVGAKLRLGVTWVPFVHLGLGAGLRHRSTATLVRDGQRDPSHFTPDGMAAAWSLDLVAMARVGMDRRLGVHWFLGADAAVSRAIGMGARSLEVMTLNVSCAYSWYPL